MVSYRVEAAPGSKTVAVESPLPVRILTVKEARDLAISLLQAAMKAERGEVP